MAGLTQGATRPALLFLSEGGCLWDSLVKSCASTRRRAPPPSVVQYRGVCLLRKCAVFGVQQAVIFAISFGLVTALRAITGVDARAGRTPIGAVSFLAISGMFTVIVLCTRWFYRFTDEPMSRDAT